MQPNAQLRAAHRRRAQNRSGEALDPLRKAALGGHREAQSLLASMYVNGRGVDRNLPLAMLWWARSSRNAIPDDRTDISKDQLSLLRRGLHRRIFSDHQRRDVLKGFALIRHDLRSGDLPAGFQMDPGRARLGNHSSLGSHHRLGVIIERALALDEAARDFLREQYQRADGSSSGDAEEIHQYFFQTAKEGDPYSCEVIRGTRLVAYQPLKKSCMRIKA